MVDDTLVWPLLEGLAAELKEEIERSELEEPCFLGVLPGAGIAYDYCTPCSTAGKCGMAWVRLALITPQVDPRIGSSRCGDILNPSIEMGILRCHKTLMDNGAPMSMEYQESKTRAQMAEMAAILRVLLCSDVVKELDVTLGGYTPIGPEGGCVGGAWIASFGP